MVVLFCEEKLKEVILKNCHFCHCFFFFFFFPNLVPCLTPYHLSPVEVTLVGRCAK